MAKQSDEAPEKEIMACLICDNAEIEIKRCKGGSARFTTYCVGCGCRMFFGEITIQKLDQRKLIYTL